MNAFVNLSTKEKISLMSNLTTMLTAGIPILEAIDSLMEEAKGGQKKILHVIREDLMAGNSLHISFAKFPRVFNQVTVNLLRAAEEAGTLETTLRDLKANMQIEMRFNDKIKSALFYPTVILVIFAMVFLMILIVVIPRISKVFMRLKVPLPLPTQILIAISNFTLHYYYLVIAGMITIAILFVYLQRYHRERLVAVGTSLPIISSLVKKVDIVRFTRSLHLLLISGIPITVALKLAGNIIVSREVRALVTHARQLAAAGEPFSKHLKTKKNLFPSLVIKLMEVGEKTGTLDKAMQDISEYMDYEVVATLNNFVTLLEPVMLVFVGVSVGALMLAIIAPIYGLISQVGSL